MSNVLEQRNRFLTEEENGTHSKTLTIQNGSYFPELTELNGTMTEQNGNYFP
jgi:hypothetical protein